MNAFARYWVLAAVLSGLGAQTAQLTRAQDIAGDAAATQPEIDPFELLIRQIETAAATRSAKKYASCFDFDGLFRTSVRTVEIAPGQDFRVRNAFDNAATGFVQSVVNSLEPAGDYRLVRKLSTEGPVRLLFRLSHPVGLNYHILLIGPTNLGDLRIVELDNLGTGELLSQSIQRILHQALIRAGLASAIALPAREQMQQMSEMNRLLTTGATREALDFYTTLPEMTKQVRLVQLMRVQAALTLKDPELQRAMEEYRQRFPGDAAMELLLMDALMRAGEMEQAEAAIDRLDAALGGDPLLDVYRSSAALARGDVERASMLAQRAAQNLPHVCAAQNQLLVVALRRKDHAEALRLMRLLRDEFRMEFLDITQLPEFAEFVKSQQYLEWRGTGKPAPATAPSGPRFKF